jgi:hypothetical protein
VVSLKKDQSPVYLDDVDFRNCRFELSSGSSAPCLTVNHDRNPTKIHFDLDEIGNPAFLLLITDYVNRLYSFAHDHGPAKGKLQAFLDFSERTGLARIQWSSILDSSPGAVRGGFGGRQINRESKEASTEVCLLLVATLMLRIEREPQDVDIFKILGGGQSVFLKLHYREPKHAATANKRTGYLTGIVVTLPKITLDEVDEEIKGQILNTGHVFKNPADLLLGNDGPDLQSAFSNASVTIINKNQNIEFHLHNHAWGNKTKNEVNGGFFTSKNTLKISKKIDGTFVTTSLKSSKYNACCAFKIAIHNPDPVSVNYEAPLDFESLIYINPELNEENLLKTLTRLEVSHVDSNAASIAARVANFAAIVRTVVPNNPMGPFVGDVVQLGPVGSDLTSEYSGSLKVPSGSLSLLAQLDSLYSHIARYGFDPINVFWHTVFPLIGCSKSDLFVREKVWKTLANAQVYPKHQGNETLDNRSAQLFLIFGLLSTNHRRYGMALDNRMIWHEFGHLFAYGVTGELELRFTHSLGDSMSAILFDPESSLRGKHRALTLPWKGSALDERTHIPRHQDRSFLWNTLIAEIEQSSSKPAVIANKLGYKCEQASSQTLFRIYRALGGDSSNLEKRLEASDRTLFLLFKTQFEMGSAPLTPCRTPGQFMSSLIVADATTSIFEAKTGPTFSGGLLRKVIEWSFRKQDLRSPLLSPVCLRLKGTKALPVKFDDWVEDEVNATEFPVLYSWDNNASFLDPNVFTIDKALKQIIIKVQALRHKTEPDEPIAVTAYYAELLQFTGPIPDWQINNKGDWTTLETADPILFKSNDVTLEHQIDFKWPNEFVSGKSFAIFVRAECPSDPTCLSILEHYQPKDTLIPIAHLVEVDPALAVAIVMT